MVMIGEKPWVKFVPQTENYGKFIVEPLERGYGSTLGNSLRRVLLSSLLGSAVTTVKIEGVQHEFSTISSVKEDVMEIILNIKEIVVKSHSESPKIITLSIKGKKDVTAADIEHDAEIEIINPEHHIATIEGSGALKIEMTVERGKGFVVSERNKRENQPIGTIPVDSIFTPVKKVNITTEEVRVGQEINYDRLILDVWTNGSIKPDDAVKESAKILMKHMEMFMKLGLRADEASSFEAGGAESEETILNMNVEDLELSARSSNCLKRAEINTVKDLVKFSESELMRVKNFGSKSAEEVKEKLAEYGVALKGDSEIVSQEENKE